MSKLKVLFLCTHNSARSQMAEGLLRHFYDDRYDVFSAGSTPTQVNPFAIKVMAEIGVDISKQRSKSIEEFRNKDIDVVVSVCSSSVRVVCPFCSSPIVGDRPEIIHEILSGARHYLHHGFSDPSEVDGNEKDKTEAFRRTRDEIRKWLLDYFSELKKEDSDINA